jgi:hypothetical protein
MRCRIRMLLEAATANHAGPTYSLPLFPDGEGRTVGNSLGPRERGNWPGLQRVITGLWSAVYSMTRGSILDLKKVVTLIIELNLKFMYRKEYDE